LDNFFTVGSRCTEAAALHVCSSC